MEQAKVTEEVESSILEKGYKRMVLLELYLDHQGIRKNANIQPTSTSNLQGI